MSQVLSQLQDIITIIFFAVGLIAFKPLLILILFIAIIPSFLGETTFSERTYSLTRSWTPQRRELDYLRYIGASDETAKEIKIFGLQDFISERFKKVADEYYQANKKLATSRAFWGSLLSSIGNFGLLWSLHLYHYRHCSGQYNPGKTHLFGGLIFANAKYATRHYEPL